MRLIRTVVQPANIALSRQLQHSQITKTSTDLLQQVLIETCNREHGSNRQWFGRSYSTASSDPALETNNTRRRVSRNERKSMVEKFVIRYREMNAGKFPSVTEAKNDVGGSYYLVRELLQELVYNSKNVLPEKKVTFKHEISSYTAGEVITPIPTVDLEESSSESFKSDQELKSSISVESDESEDVGTVHENELKFTLALEPENGKTVHENEHKFTLSLEPENGKTVHENERKFTLSLEPENGKTVHENELKLTLALEPENGKIAHEDEEKLGDEIVHEKDEQKSNVLQSKAELQESTEEVSASESHKVTNEVLDYKTKPSVWQNLKSFANGILDVWKRY